MIDADEVMNPQHFGRDQAETQIQIWVNPAIQIVSRSLLAELWRWWTFGLFEHSLVVHLLHLIVNQCQFLLGLVFCVFFEYFLFSSSGYQCNQLPGQTRL